jgi:hypothetical protein
MPWEGENGSSPSRSGSAQRERRDGEDRPPSAGKDPSAASPWGSRSTSPGPMRPSLDAPRAVSPNLSAEQVYNKLLSRESSKTSVTAILPSVSQRSPRQL